MSFYLWSDDSDKTHEIQQAKKNKFIFYQVLRLSQSRVRPHENFLAFHDDVCAVAQSKWIVDVHLIVDEDMWQDNNIQINASKVRRWNKSSHVQWL